MTLDELLNDVAAKGELTHFSVAFSLHGSKVGQWIAAYTPSHQYGVSWGMGTTPVAAALEAIQAIKRKKSATNGNTRIKDKGEGQQVPEAAD